MKKNKYILLSFIVLLLAHPQSYAQEVNGVEIINSLIDSLYDVDYCHRRTIIRPPRYKCCSEDSLTKEELIDCCKKSTIPAKYRAYCQKCVNESEYDALDKISIISDTLFQLSFEEYHINKKKYLLSKIPDSSKFYLFIKNNAFNKPKSFYNIQELKNTNTRYISPTDAKEFSAKGEFGLVDDKFIIGYFGFSRIYYDSDLNVGIFGFVYLGGSACGYKEYVLFYKKNDTWRIYKKINNGVF